MVDLCSKEYCRACLLHQSQLPAHQNLIQEDPRQECCSFSKTMLSHSYHTKCPKECDNGASVCEPTVAWIQPAFYLTLSSTTSSRIPDAKLGEGPIIGIWRQEEMSVSGETCPGATRWKAHMHMKTHVCGFHVPAGFLSLEPSSWDSRRQGR